MSSVKISARKRITAAESFSWEEVLEEMRERAPEVLDFISTISIPINKERADQVTPECVTCGLMMHTRWRELSLIQKVMNFILGIGRSTSKVNVFGSDQ